MRDEEILKERYEMFSTRNHLPNQNNGTSIVDHSPQYDQNVDRSPDSDDGNNPTNEHQPTEEETGQDEPDEITPPEPRTVPRDNAMSFKMTQFTPASESEDELSHPLPLGC